MSLLSSRPTRAFNRFVGGLVRSPRTGPHLRRWFTLVTYTGRRSGRTISTPVSYRRGVSPGVDTTELVVVDVLLPETKTWWRNFTGDGAPLSLQLPEGERGGLATAVRRSERMVRLTVRLDPRRVPGRDAA